MDTGGRRAGQAARKQLGRRILVGARQPTDLGRWPVSTTSHRVDRVGGATYLARGSQRWYHSSQRLGTRSSLKSPQTRWGRPWPHPPSFKISAGNIGA